jgi:hypothetical protein
MSSYQQAPFTIDIADGPVAPWLDRTFAGLAAAAASFGYWLLLRIEPDPRGHGTHEQLGLEACGWPVHYGIPCPTCGCTTAACLLVHGRIVDAFVTQPFGAAFTAIGLLFGVHGVLCLLRARSFVDILVRLSFWRWVSGAIALLLVSWLYVYWRWPQ